MAFHTPHGSARFRLPWSWSSFDYRELCRALCEQTDARFEIAKVRGAATGDTVQHRPRRPDRAADRRRARLAPRPRPRRQRPAARGARSAAASRSTRTARGTDLDVWIDRSWSATATPGRCPRDGEQRVGVGSYEPRRPRQGADARRSRSALGRATPSATRATGSRTELRPAAEDGVFFAGDSAGHCIPLSGEGIRTAFYFGIAAGRRDPRGAGRRADARAGAGGATRAFSARARARRSRCALALQRTIPRAAAARADRAAARDGPRAPVPARVRLVPQHWRTPIMRRVPDGLAQIRRQAADRCRKPCLRSSSMPRRGSTPSPGLPDRAAFLAAPARRRRARRRRRRAVPRPGRLQGRQRRLRPRGRRPAADPGRRSACEAAVRDEDIVARLGGDEFTVLLRRARRPVAGATITAGRIARRARRRRSTSPGQRRHVRVSIGCRVAAPREADAEELLRDADAAMYQAKERGKDRVELFSDATRAPPRCAGSSSSSELRRRARASELLEVHYQPQVDLATGRLVGVEALARWARDGAAPAEFIPVAEETGLIGPLGAWVLGTATARARGLARAGPDAADGHRQRLRPPARGPGLPDRRRDGARRRRPRARVPVPGDDRDRADGRRRARRSDCLRALKELGVYVGDRRLRHRPLLAGAPEALPGRGRSRSTARSSTASAPSRRTPRSSRRSCRWRTRSACT